MDNARNVYPSQDPVLRKGFSFDVLPHISPYIYYINKIKVDVTCFVFNKFKLCKIIFQRVWLSSSGLLHSNVETLTSKSRDVTLRYLNYIGYKTFNLGLKHRMKCFSFANLAEILSVRILKKGNI